MRQMYRTIRCVPETAGRTSTLTCPVAATRTKESMKKFMPAGTPLPRGFGDLAPGLSVILKSGAALLTEECL